MKRVCRTHLAQNTHITADLLNTVGSSVPSGGGVFKPPRNSESPPKPCQTHPDCENC